MVINAGPEPSAVLAERAPRADGTPEHRCRTRASMVVNAQGQRLCNEAAAGRIQDSLGGMAPALQALNMPPYVAVNISTDNPTFPCPAITLGGLRVNESNGLVINQAEQAIPGLYAAGRAAVGIASNGYVSGLSLADCLWSGRRAGQSMGTSTD
jgi:hypothetical protein